MGWRVGVDSGGTFTDICLFEEVSGRLEIWKVSSTPSDPSVGISGGVAEALSVLGVSHGAVSYLGHGTTVSTNALIQSRGVKTGLITTDGFSDLLEIGRQKRPQLYDQQVDKPLTIVPRELRFGVRERVLHNGAVEVVLDEAAVREAAVALKNAGVHAVAVSFLYSFVNSDHESVARRIIEEVFPDAFVSISSEVAPEFREFERLSTTVINCYLGPVMRGYIDRLVSRFSDMGIKPSLRITQSNGGVISPGMASTFPVRTLLSGPSTGVVAAQAIAEATGISKLITFDMGGTSSDVALINDGKAASVNEAMIHGYPIKAPMIDIHTVGAGGGSIAAVDEGGLLKVGPRSAGADPGPAAYGKGNLEPTVTDANVLLQTLNPETLLNGRMKIDRELSEKAVQAVAEKLGLSLMETAVGILEIVTANMAKAIRVISVQRGYDPRDYTMVAFGGAGPLHAARLAQELGIKRILVPPTPGTLCALGLLMTDVRTDFSTTSLRVLDLTSPAEVESIYDELESKGENWFLSEGVTRDRQRLRRTIDVRYLGQNYEIAVGVPSGPITGETFKEIQNAFLEAHNQLYGFVSEGVPIQFVTYRVEAIGVVEKVKLARSEAEVSDVSRAVVGHRQVWDSISNSFVNTPIYDRQHLRPGIKFNGPAIVDQMDTTTFVPSGFSASVDQYFNLMLESEENA